MYVCSCILSMLNIQHKFFKVQQKSSLMFSVLILLCSFILNVSAQQCLSLNGSSACPMFPNASISIRDSKFVALPWLVNVSTLAEFDYQLLNYVNSTNFWNTELGCRSATIRPRARFSVSLTCATIVFDTKSSTPCNSTSNATIPMCQSSCKAYSKSVEAILHSYSQSSICGASLITAGSNSISQQCKINSGLKGLPSTGCIAAFDHETTMCGFGDDRSTLCQYCNEYDSTLPCCKQYSCLKSAPVLSAGSIAGIVSGVVSVLLICGLIAFCVIQRHQKSRRLTYPNDFMYHHRSHLQQQQKHQSKDLGPMVSSSYHLSHSGSALKMMSHPSEHHIIRNGMPIEDNDYMEVLPDVHMQLDESINGHVFKVNSLEKQFVRVIYPLKNPENPDELELLKNDIIRMYYYFDDGWAFGDNFGSGLRGLFPLLCVVNLTPEEVHELIYLSELSEEELQQHENTGEGYYSSVRHFSTGVPYDLDPRATYRLQNLRKTLTIREKSPTPTNSEENNFHYLCAASSMTPIHNEGGMPPMRTASMQASFNIRRTAQDPLHLQEEEYFRSECSGSTAVTNNTPDSKTYLNGY